MANSIEKRGSHVSEILLSPTTDYQKQPGEEKTATEKSKYLTFRWMLGVVFVIIVAIIWTLSSVLVQYIFHDLSYDKPFFLTYIGVALFAINLPIWYTTEYIKMWYRGKNSGDTDRSSFHAKIVEKSNWRAVIRVSAVIAPLWFIANFTYNQSLDYTSVTSNTIMSSTSTVFTFLISVLALKEPFNWWKLLGVALCMGGNVVTLANDSDSENDHVWGDIEALFSSFMYAVYTTVIRRMIPDEEQVSISVFFGFIGLISLVCIAPVEIIFHFTNVESLDGLTWKILGLLVFNTLFNNVLSDYLWARSVLLTSPTVATVGLSLTVPVAIISDRIFNDTNPTGWTILAALLVIAGFVLINLISKKQAVDEHEEKEQAKEAAEIDA